jgi:hypothetical protein
MEFKEVLAYARRWIFVIAGVSVGMAVLAFVAVDYLPNPEGQTHFSAVGEFETPSDPYRIISYGDTSFARRVVLDPNTEIANVTGYRNVEAAVRYFAVLEVLVSQIDSTQARNEDGSLVRVGTGTEPYQTALAQLEAKAGEIRNDGSANPYYYEVNVEGNIVGLTSVVPERINQLRMARLALRPIVEPVNNSRRVVVSVTRAKSANEARMWVDAILLAAKRESFQKLLDDFEAIARRFEDEFSRVTSAVTDARRAELEAMAEVHVAAKVSLARASRQRVLATGMLLDEEAEAVPPVEIQFFRCRSSRRTLQRPRSWSTMERCAV